MPPSDSIALLSALIRTRQLMPDELVGESIRRIKAVNPQLNAVVISRFDAAMNEAREATARLSDPHFDPPFLFGIPFTAKETFSVAGYPSTFGLYANRKHIARATAPAISNLLEQGAILVGLTNTPECCFWMECGNTIYGRTNNPCDTGRTCGGSSGGEAAIVASGAVPFGVGSDMAGSIRMPAAFCGIWGHSPSGGLISIDWHYPYDFTQSNPPNDTSRYAHLLKTGPMCRSARDLESLCRIMQGSSCHPELPGSTSPEAISVYVLSNPRIRLASGCDRVISEATLQTAARLESLGMVVKKLPDDLFYHAFDIWRSKMKAASGEKTLSQQFGIRNAAALALEIVKKMAGLSRHTLPGLLMCAGELLYSGKGEEKYLRMADELNCQLTGLLGSTGILLMPVHPRVAPKHGYAVLKPYDWNYTTIANALDLPATAVPAGFDERGLPVAIQLIAGRGNDRLNFSVAELLDQTTPRSQRFSNDLPRIAAITSLLCCLLIGMV